MKDDYYFSDVSKKFKEEIPTLIFKNAPVDNKEHDVFDFHFQARVLKSVIDEGSNIIGIIGEYGSGKSSLTEIFRKEFDRNFSQIVTINLWDSCQKTSLLSTDDLENEGQKTKPFSLLTKSFLYQLAFANDKKNSAFAQYINERFNKNHGKISFSIASKKSLWLFGFAGLSLVLFFSLQDAEILNLLPKFFIKLKFLTYLFPFISALLAYRGLHYATPVFSLWDSQGKIVPDSSDLFDIYKQITNRLIHREKKTLVFIEDLDRTAEKNLVVSFLKELYRLLNFLPTEQKRKIVFIVSLKAEEQLNYGKQDDSDTQNIYSKIFDYTLYIKTLHYENCTDIVRNLLERKKSVLTKVFDKPENEVIPQTIRDLQWILKDENVSVREIKDRMNEIFILYQTLKNRNYENSSIELKKCTAVVLLKRKYPTEYYKLLRHEKEFAELIRNNYRNTGNKDFSIIIDFMNAEETTNQKTEMISEKFLSTLTAMLKDRSIDNDFLMYFYNYPTGSYIKTLDEKEVSDCILHGLNFDVPEWDEKIERIITDKKGKVIYDALAERQKDGIPTCIYKNEKIFVFLIKETTYKNFIKNEICKKIEEFNGISEIDEEEITEEITLFTKLYSDLILYDYDIKIKEVFIKDTLTVWLELARNEVQIVSKFRKHFINSLGIFLPYFKPLFTEIKGSFISAKEIEKLQNIFNLLPLLKEFTESELKQIDELYIDFFYDENIITFLEEKKLLRSSLLSRSQNNTLTEFDFTQDWVVSELITIAKEIYTKHTDTFLQIRITALAQYKGTKDDFYTLFLLPYPLITEQELTLINSNEDLYFFLDHKQITTENLYLLSNYCNKIQFQGSDLFAFFEVLFFHDDECKVAEGTIIAGIIKKIDFTCIKFNSMLSDEIDRLVEFLTPIFNLTNALECMQFMEVIHCLLPQLEKIIDDAIKTDTSIFEKYVNLINKIDNPTETTIEIVKDKKITCSLVSSITDKLYANKCFIQYLVGKTLFDKAIPLDKKIPLDKYYSVFISTNECKEYFINTDLLKQFVDDGLIYKGLPADLLPLFYTLRQPITLVTYILEKLQTNSDEMKNYLYSIEHFDTENDAFEFIKLITKKPYVELLHENDLFYFVWHKMWTHGQKGSLTQRVNKILGTNYSAKEANKP